MKVIQFPGEKPFIVLLIAFICCTPVSEIVGIFFGVGLFIVTIKI